MRIFISYSHCEDFKGHMKRVFEYLNTVFQKEEVNGFYYDKDNFWLDENEIQAGNNYDKLIKEGINNSDYFILFFSNPYLQSTYVSETELPEIIKLCKERGTLNNIIPVRFAKTIDKFWTTIEHKYFLEEKISFAIGNKTMYSTAMEFENNLTDFVNEIKDRLFPGVLNLNTLPPPVITANSEKIKNNRFRINRENQFNNFKDSILFRLKILKKPAADKVKSGILFFSGSFDQLINNFVLRIPRSLGDDLKNENYNFSKLDRTQNLKNHLKGEARIVDEGLSADIAIDMIVDRMSATSQKFLKDESIKAGEKIIIPLFLWFKDDVSYVIALFDRLKTDLHQKVCEGDHDIFTKFESICYFISVIYDDDLKGSSFEKNLLSTINSAANKDSIWHISGFDDVSKDDFSNWLDLLSEDSIDTASIKNNYPSLFANAQTISMNKIDDYIINEKYLS